MQFASAKEGTQAEKAGGLKGREGGRKFRLAILTNLVPPYRVPVYRQLGEVFDLSVFISAGESNRHGWECYAQQLHHVKIHPSAGLSFPIADSNRGGVFDLRFIHINPGYVLDLLRSHPHAILSVEMGFRTICALAYGTLCRTPVWIWWGGTVHTESKVGRARRFLRWIISRWARRWLSYGETSTEYLCSIGIPRRRITQLQNCVDESMFLVNAGASINAPIRPALLFVGQLINRKGLRQLLESGARLQQAGHEFSLVLVGDGPERAMLRQLANDLKLKHVCFEPPKSAESMPGVYRSADCVVFPTLEDVWGLVVNEAIWSGVPVVSSIYAGCTSEIVPPENRFNPLDPRDFDRILLKALKGTIAPPESGVLRTAAQVANLVADAIAAELDSKGKS